MEQYQSSCILLRHIYGSASLGQWHLITNPHVQHRSVPVQNCTTFHYSRAITYNCCATSLCAFYGLAVSCRHVLHFLCQVNMFMSELLSLTGFLGKVSSIQNDTAILLATKQKGKCIFLCGSLYWYVLCSATGIVNLGVIFSIWLYSMRPFSTIQHDTDFIEHLLTPF